MRSAFRVGLVTGLVLVGLFAGPSSRAAACEDPWSCFNEPSEVDVTEQYDAGQLGVEWGTAIHTWVVDAATAVWNWFMQEPPDYPAPGAPITAGYVTPPTTGGNLFIFLWDD